MTRINVAIKPSELSNKHLISELREIKRIPNCIVKGRFSLKNIPDSFKLGKGHVSFFYNKLNYVRDRYVLLYNEGIIRGFDIQNYIDSFDIAISKHPELANGYQEKESDRKILIDRLIERDYEYYNLI